MPVGYNQIESCYQSLHEQFVIACLTRFTTVKRKRPAQCFLREDALLRINHRSLCQLQIDHEIEPPFYLEK